MIVTNGAWSGWIALDYTAFTSSSTWLNYIYVRPIFGPFDDLEIRLLANVSGNVTGAQDNIRNAIVFQEVQTR